MKSKSTPRKAVATDETIEQMLWDCLAEIPCIETQRVEQRVIADPGRPEIMARVRINGQERLLLAEVKSNGQPRLVREAVESIARYRQSYADSYGLVIAPSFSPQAIKICRQEGIGYLDHCGNCQLNFDFVFINKEGRLPTGTKKKKNFRSWYSPRSEKVLRTMFAHPQRVWTIRELALEAHSPDKFSASSATSPNVSGWRNTSTASRWPIPICCWMNGPPTTWRHAASSASSPRPTMSLRSKPCLPRSVMNRSFPYALMGFSAAMRFDPMFHYDRVSAYILSDLSKVISALELTETPGKGNVSLWIPYDESVLRAAEQFDHAKITSPIQTYLDLIGIEGRGEKAANDIWQNFMKDKWAPKPVAA